MCHQIVRVFFIKQVVQNVARDNIDHRRIYGSSGSSTAAPCSCWQPRRRFVIDARHGGRALHVQATEEPVSDVLHGGSGSVLPGSLAGHMCVIRAYRQGAVSEFIIDWMPRCNDGPAQVSHG